MPQRAATGTAGEAAAPGEESFPPWQAAIYVRVSTDGPPADQQRRACEAYCADRGFRVVRTYQDAAEDITEAGCPDLNQLITDANAGAFQRIVCASADRLAKVPMTSLAPPEDQRQLLVCSAKLGECLSIAQFNAHLVTRL